ncbi:MAG: sodium ion-translocating decarboxylase subunit beta [Chloroflexota bacterium]|nr:sodium ion-translocating decarboxylase subunit beta [Chloroflexota bacterium]
MLDLYATGFQYLTWGNVVMLVLAGVIIYLGIARKMEPVLLVPIGIGMVMVNLPLIGLMVYDPSGFPAEAGNIAELISDIGAGKIGLLNVLYSYGIKSEVIPLLIFLGVGAMTDFGPAITRPISFVFSAAAQIGIFVVFIIAFVSGLFTMNEAACVGIIGGSDGPPTVYLTAALAPQILGPVTLVAYSYMALVPIIQPPIIRLLTSKRERAIYMKPELRKPSKRELILFPIAIFVVASLLVPKSGPLIGMFMFGNLLRVTGVTDRLARSAGTGFIDVLTFLLGLGVGALMPAQVFLSMQTLAIIGLAIVAFALGTGGGVLTAKVVNLFLKEPINPLIGAAGVSAVPMAARVAHKMGQDANPRNYLLMHAMGPNMAGAIATSVVAGLFLGVLG